MKIYKIAQKFKEDAVVWKCPITGIYIMAPRINGEIIEYSIYYGDGSFVDAYSTWREAVNVAYRLDRNVEIPRMGKLEK
jgi:hypothetical protein